jgi:hypothetical protein
MKICVLCEDSKVELARENAKKILGGPDKTNAAINPLIAKAKGFFGLPEQGSYLQIPCSATGESPATHWFCFMNVTEEGYTKVKSVQEHSVIEESSPKEFLEKWNLKIIK